MPSSGDELILKLLSKSVARLESGGGKRKQDEEEVTFLESVKKVKIDQLVDTFAGCNTILIESILVYNHLIKVSPELALELSSLHTLPYVSNHLKKVSPKLAEDLATVPNKFAKKQEKTKPTNKKTGITPKRFTPLEDATIKAAVKEAGECGVDHEALAKRLNRQKKSVIHRIETLERTGGVIENLQFTLVEDSMLLESLVIPQSRSRKLSKIVLLNHQCSNLAKELGKTPRAVVRRWNYRLQPWLLQHYSGTLNLRVERMLANYISTTFTDFSDIDWPKVTSRNEFAGHTEISMRDMYFRKSEKTRVKFGLQSDEVTPEHVAEYCELVYGVGAKGIAKLGASINKSQRQKDVISLFEMLQKDFV